MEPTPLKTFTKDPADRRAVGIDWSRWLRPGKVLVSSSWRFHGSSYGATIGSGEYAPNFDHSKTWLYPFDGLPGRTYLFTNTVEDNSTPPNRGERTIAVVIVER